LAEEVLRGVKPMGLHDYGIYEVIKRNGRVNGGRTALIGGGLEITYLQLLENVDRLACGLLRSGLGKGDRIAIMAPNSLEYFYLYGAAAKIGNVVVPVNWRLNPQEVDYVMRDCCPKAVFVGPEFLNTMSPLIPKWGFLEKRYVMGQGEGGFAAFRELLDNDGASAEVEGCSDDPYVIIHTAAVGGYPRGAMLSQRGLLTSSLQFLYCWRLTREDCNLCILPLFHFGGLGTTLSVMHAGGKTILLPRFDADLAVKHLVEDKVTVMGEFPPILTTLLDKAKAMSLDIRSLRVVVGLDQPETIKRFQETTGGEFWVFYGQTETSGLVSLSPYSEKPGSAGVAGIISEIEIMDDSGRILEAGQTGEIVVRGPMVFKGYWNREKDNAYTFREGWHHTGDLGCLDRQGYLWYKGRKSEKELIKPGGENVYPLEVERVILDHPSVKEVSVIGVPDRQWGEAIKAVCVLKEGTTLTEGELIEFVGARIARYKKPKFVKMVTDLPRKGDGSIDREEIKALYGFSES
jgi:acyl-CoA synthetase (AMP-forming)/AMP-acid ligase II